MELEQDKFEEEIKQSDKPALVMFWGSWCPVCKRNEPMVRELKQELEDKVKIRKMNIDRNPRVSSEFKIAGTPTYYLFEEGEKRGRKVGSVTKGQLRKFIENNTDSLKSL